MIDGNAGDSVHANGQGWLHGDDITVGAVAYAVYTQDASAVQLLIDLDITRKISWSPWQHCAECRVASARIDSGSKRPAIPPSVLQHLMS